MQKLPVRALQQMSLAGRTEPMFNEGSYYSYIAVGILPAIAAINRPEPFMAYAGVGYALFIFLVMHWSHSRPIGEKIDQA